LVNVLFLKLFNINIGVIFLKSVTYLFVNLKNRYRL